MFKVFHQKNLEPSDNTISKWLTIDTNIGTYPYGSKEKRPYIMGYCTFHRNELLTPFIQLLHNKTQQTTFLQNSELIRNLTLTEYLILAQNIKKQNNTFNKKLNKFIKPIE